MLGSLTHGDVSASQPHDGLSTNMGELFVESTKFSGVRGAVIGGAAGDIDYILCLGFPVFCCYRTPADILGRCKLVVLGQGL